MARPLTERILDALPGPRALWIVLWGGAALLRIGALIVVLEVTGTEAPNQATLDSAVAEVVFGYVIVVMLVGTGILVRRVDELDPVLRAIAPATPASGWFKGITSVAGPVALTALGVAASVPSTLAEFGIAVVILDLFTLTLVLLPIMTFVWTYLMLLIGLDRLGRADLTLDRFPEDRTMGLGPIGQVAMTGFWVMILSAAPVFVFAGRDLPTIATSVTAIAVTVAVFVLSMIRIHAKMRSAKARYLAQTQAMVADAYAPVRADPRVPVLAANAEGLAAAEALADRAERILEWPIDERMVAWMTVVVTGVVTSLVVSFVLQAVGST